MPAARLDVALGRSPMPHDLDGDELGPEPLLVLSDRHLVVRLGVGPQTGHRDVRLADLALDTRVVRDVVPDQASVIRRVLDPDQDTSVEVSGI